MDDICIDSHKMLITVPLSIHLSTAHMLDYLLINDDIVRQLGIEGPWEEQLGPKDGKEEKSTHAKLWYVGC